MPSQDECKTELIRAFSEGTKGRPGISQEVRARLQGLCDQWVPNPPNAEGQTVADLWDQQHGDPPRNGEKFKAQFRRMGKLAAAKAKAAHKDQIEETEYQEAYEEVVSDSVCPWCPGS